MSMKSNSPKKQEKKKLLFLTTSLKGGVGSSTTALNLSIFHRMDGRRVAVMDSDKSVGRLHRVLSQKNSVGKIEPEQDPLKGCARCDAFHLRDQTKVLSLATIDCDLAVIDLPSSALPQLSMIYGKYGDTSSVFETYTEQGFQLVVVLTVTPEINSLASIHHAIQTFGDGAKYVIVRNWHHAIDEEDWGMWHGTKRLDGSSAGGKIKLRIEDMAAAGNAAVVDMPSLKMSIIQTIDIESTRPDLLVTDKRLSVDKQSMLQRWLAITRRSFEQAGPLLGFSDTAVLADEESTETAEPRVEEV